MILVLLKTRKSIVYAGAFISYRDRFARCLNELGIYTWIGIFNKKFLDNTESSSMSFFLSSIVSGSQPLGLWCVIVTTWVKWVWHRHLNKHGHLLSMFYGRLGHLLGVGNFRNTVFVIEISNLFQISKEIN